MLRTILFWIHLSAGVTAGAVILMMSVTGAALAFQPQLLELAEGRLDVEPPGTEAESPGIEELLERARTEGSAAFGSFRPVTVTLEADPTAPVVVTGTGDQRVYLDPHSGALLSTGFPRLEGWFESLRGWHRWFNVTGGGRRHGRAFTGAANLVLLLLLVSGPILWIPRTPGWGRLRNVLWFRRGLRAKARDFNWHNVLGIWAAVPLILIAASATVTSYAWAGELVARLTPDARNGGTPPGAERGEPAPSGAADLDAVAQAAGASVPGWQEIVLLLPRTGASTVEARVYRGYAGQPQRMETLTLDASSGELLDRRTFLDQSRSSRYRTALRYAHTGEYWGLPGQAVAGAASMAAALLAFTGVSMAIRRLVAFRRRRRARGPATPIDPGSSSG